MSFVKRLKEVSDLKFLNRVRNVFVLIGFGIFIALCLIDYDDRFWATALLPIMYVLATTILVDNRFLQFGIGSFSLVMFYCVRMCVFPFIIALGNFYFEPSESLYIEYYLYSVLLMGCENFLIFFIARTYITRYYRTVPYVEKTANKPNSFIYITIIIFTIVTFSTFYLKGIDYYHLITEETISKFYADENRIDRQSGFFWYLSDYLSALWRILLSSYIMIKGYNRYPSKILLIALLVATINMLFLSDRRVFAVIVAIFCLFYYLRNFATGRNRKIIVACLILSVVIMGYYFSFTYAEQGGLAMVARSVQRYFSGPSLSALALRINSDISVVPDEFFKLLYNDFQSLVGLFGRLELQDFVGNYFPSKGIWTPLVPGALRYFGIFFPIPLIFITWCVVKWDCMNRKSSNYLHSMLYSYISFSISFYLIMYSIELMFYFIVATGLILNVIINFDKKVRIKRSC